MPTRIKTNTYTLLYTYTLHYIKPTKKKIDKICFKTRIKFVLQKNKIGYEKNAKYAKYKRICKICKK